ncbi:MAG: hypothetical protein ABJA82_13225, partial [Myxococcales bacterium]
MMGVRKFRSVADMPGPPVLPRLDPENLRLAFGLSSFAAAFRPVLLTPGVRKFQSWDELWTIRAAAGTRSGSSDR